MPGWQSSVNGFKQLRPGNNPDPVLSAPTLMTSSTPRTIKSVPYKVLDAPDLKDDFYLNLLDWSAKNVVAVALGQAIYFHNPDTSNTRKFKEFNVDDGLTSLSFSKTGNTLAVGTHNGKIQLWNVETSQMIRTYSTHTHRVNCLAWNDNGLLTASSRDKTITIRDPRSPNVLTQTFKKHTQEVCSLKWSKDNEEFASGGGTADAQIHLWSTVTGKELYSVDTGSQVCNLAWSKNVNELVSTGGYQQNAIKVWKYHRVDGKPALLKIKDIEGQHSNRVLYLATSPNGESIVTGAGSREVVFK